MRTSKQCCGLFMSRFILSAIWQTSPKDRGWSSLLHQRGKNNMSAEQLEKEHIRKRFVVQIYPATLVRHLLWYKLKHIDIFYIWNLKLILPNMTSKQFMNGRAWNLGKLRNTTHKICHHLQTPYFGSFLSNLEDEAFMIFGKPFCWTFPPLAVNLGQTR